MDADKRFSGKVAIVTGAASGIGLATAKRLGSEGASIIIADLHPSDTAKDAVQKAGAADVWTSACDVSQEAQVEATVAGTLQRHGRLDVIVNNAGLMIFKSIEDHTGADWL